MEELKKIIQFDENQTLANGIQTDYKAEIVAAGFIEHGYESENTLIMRNGASHRGIAKDVENIEAIFIQNALADYLHINTNRDGIYDSLPEVVFHANTQTENKKTKNAVLQEIHRHRVEETKSRAFFRPLETAIDQTRIFVQIREMMIDKKNIYRNFVDMFTQYWPIINLLPLPQAVYFMQAIPILRDINNDFGKISQVMTGILGYKVQILKGKLMPAEYDTHGRITQLGSCKLGRSMILGNCFVDGYYSIQMLIGPLQRKDIEYFIKDAEGDKILQALINMIMPCDRLVEIRFKVVSEYEKCTLSGGKEVGSRLGINAVLI